MTLTITYIHDNDKATSVSFEVESYVEALGYMNDIEPIDLSSVKEVNISVKLED